MEWVECIDCGEEFSRDEDEWWKKRCYPCWREYKGLEQVNKAREASELLRLRAEVERLKEGQEKARLIAEGLRYHLTYLIFTAHPDRNNGDRRANEATRWLLEMREMFKQEGRG